MLKKFFANLDYITSKILGVVAIVASASLVLLVFMIVLARYVFNVSVIGLDELALLAAMWLYMTGAVIASRRAEHIVVDFVPKALKYEFLSKLHQRFVAIVMLLTTVMFMYLAWDMLKFSLRMPQTTAGLRIPQIISQAAVIIASIGCFAYALRDLITGKACYNSINEEV
ncbi:TRAP transporter small permease [Salinicola corii]|uniref:TRAP transporter small permease protein n=1 Tax=Salinicola corii TaxID=2606937 RepID=A0A640W7B1_9GAMM|nr:TRAP transporter small permease subunit [Salinicola corii]KAA0015808.1 TRAP transporter small permease [Salinicola corii]